MITPKDIKEHCIKWWKEILLSSVDSAPCFPREINRIGKVGSKDILSKLSVYKESIELLRNNSKAIKKHGYSLILSEKLFDKIGRQSVPEKISIDSIEDYLKITDKEKEYNVFLKNLSLIKTELPRLIEWVKLNPTKLVEHNTWADTLKVCQFFLETPLPNMYIRQLPIDIHTKYILENKSIIQPLLDFLIPEYLNKDETKFELRYSLKYSEPLIRIRFLDTSLSPIYNATDISLTLSEFRNIKTDCVNIFVAENIMNFLTLPYLSKTIAIWSGGGFSVSYLRDIDWIKRKQFFYWGDLDAQGFQILNQFRKYFQNTVAVMMDEETLSSFKSASGTPASNQNLQQLTDKELKLYNYLRQNNIRLEQEKITQTFSEKSIYELYNKMKLPNQIDNHIHKT
ncbi:Wadjet anti-phage system protein JetD domain-containing protein [Limnovirga soli]|uniref:Wadjet protein JetD C-terminal domain-containing protein n=1 Tax=Limnovirga soli TaxID=2656915 RepID=A0A8J8JQS2_9BACT|nr:Wadjet anti-phage system protein JetD domain-containing protein [Limnovirga soli]NNV55052.1 hypothetical protein [Limnovirga soli]